MKDNKKIDSLQIIQKKFKPPQNPNEVRRKGLTKLERLGLVVTERVGTMGFFFIIFGWTLIWLSWNIFAPQGYRFDPFPAFVLWLFISNVIQIHLMPLIMVGENVLAKHSELRAQHDYETDRKAELEIETILLHLENQQKIILQILKKIENIEKNQAS